MNSPIPPSDTVLLQFLEEFIPAQTTVTAGYSSFVLVLAKGYMHAQTPTRETDNPDAYKHELQLMYTHIHTYIQAHLKDFECHEYTATDPNGNALPPFDIWGLKGHMPEKLLQYHTLQS